MSASDLKEFPSDRKGQRYHFFQRIIQNICNFPEDFFLNLMKKIIYIIIVEIKGAAVVTGKLGNLLDGDFSIGFARRETRKRSADYFWSVL